MNVGFCDGDGCERCTDGGTLAGRIKSFPRKSDGSSISGSLSDTPSFAAVAPSNPLSAHQLRRS